VGLETARQLAGQGGQIVMIARDQARGEHAGSQVAEAAAGKPPVLLLADLSVQAGILRAACQLRDRYAHADILVNNAGAAFPRRKLSADGLELTWATNHLAAFLLTELLLPRARTGQPAWMVITVQAPRWIRSPSWRGNRTPAVISLPLTTVPFSDPGSRIVQLPSGSANSTACSREMPGSVGGPVRSISGSRPRDTLRRPMRISGPASRNRRSGV